MNWTVKRTTDPDQLPVTLKDMLAYAAISSTVSTTLSSGAAEDATTITVADTTGFAVGQTIVIGDEYGVISGIAGSVLTFSPALPNAVASGAEVSYSEDNVLVLAALQASVTALENYLNRAFITQTYTYQADCFPNQIGGFGLLSASRSAPDPIELPRPDLQSVTSVEYYQTDNTLTTFSSSSYFVDSFGVRGRIVLNEGYTWPDNVRSLAAVKIIYVAGYGDDRSDVPEGIREAIKLQAQSVFEADTQPVTSEKVGGVAFSYGSQSAGGNPMLADAAMLLVHPYRLINV